MSDFGAQFGAVAQLHRAAYRPLPRSAVVIAASIFRSSVDSFTRKRRDSFDFSARGAFLAVGRFFGMSG